LNAVPLKKILLLALAVVCLGAAMARAENSVAWNAKTERLTVALDERPLGELLEKITGATGWEVFVEPGTTRTVSARFKNQPMGDGLRSLLGDLSYALVPQSNAAPHLYVFHTSLHAATERVRRVEIHIPADDTAAPIANQLVVTVKPGTDIYALAAKLGAKVIGRAAGLDTYLLEFPDAATTDAALAALKNNSSVASVDFNYHMTEPIAPANYAGNSLPTLNAKPLGSGAPTIGLIDTGFDANNYCGLSGYVAPGLNVTGSTAPAASSPDHGASMAYTIVKASNGQAKILPVNVYGASATTTTFNVANGIYAAVNAGANIINLSLGSQGDSTFLQTVIARASAQGVVFLAAAGNEPVTTPTYPAAYPQVIAVTAGNRNGTTASYANHGSFVDVVAPGTSQVCFEGNSWVVAGTSSATAFASGLAATAAQAGHFNAAQVQGFVTNTLPHMAP
jgi:thermitase